MTSVTLERLQKEREYILSQIDRLESASTRRFIFEDANGFNFERAIQTAVTLDDFETAFRSVGLLGFMPTRHPIAPENEQTGKPAKNIARMVYSQGLQDKIARPGFFAKIKNPPYKELVIETHDDFTGSGSDIILTHYNVDEFGDKWTDSEMIFTADTSKSGKIHLKETAIQDPIRGGEMRGSDISFAEMFSKNLNSQGFGSAPVNIINPGEGGEDDAPGTAAHMERDRGDGSVENQMGQEDVSDEGGGSGADSADAGPGYGQFGDGEQSDSGLPDANPDMVGTESYHELHKQNGELRPERGTPGDSDDRGGAETDEAGIQPDHATAEEIEGNDDAAVNDDYNLDAKRDAQKEANRIPVQFNDPDNIDESLPFLFKEQRGDVVKAEKRFFGSENPGKGMMFTNSTGTGKTFSGLGIINRFYQAGKKNILVVVPTDSKAKDWIEEAVNLDLKLTQLKDTKDKGVEISITTYANFAVNQALRKRDWDLIVYDESHRLSRSGDRDPSTLAMEQHRHLTAAPTVAIQRARDFDPRQPDLNRKIQAKAQEVYDELVRKQEEEDQIRRNAGETVKTDEDEKAKQEQADGFWYQAMREGQIEYWEEQKEIDKTLEPEAKRLNEKVKVVFLSATPFSYHFNLTYGDGYLFEIGENPNKINGEGYDYTNKAESGYSYNEPSPEEQFYVTNFGYRMRYNKLTEPEPEVDVALMERQFHENLKKTGALSSRRLKIDQDYSRHFVKLDSELGWKIDTGIGILRGYEDWKENHYEHIPQIFNDKFKYAYRTGLLESIKAKYSISRIKKHLALGRKVIVFHTYVNALPSHPFDLSKYKGRDENLDKEIEHFETKYSEYVNLDLTGLQSVPLTFQKALGNRCAIFNGSVKKNDRSPIIQKFNRDGSGLDIIVVQLEAGKEGISLHDKTGKTPRVVYTLALPTAPTDAIQAEGRAYRTGNKSNAIFEYATIQTNLEKFTFAEKVAKRASTAENLAMGEVARNLKTAFKDGYKNATDEDPNEYQGAGGQEGDTAVEMIDEFERAKTYYFSRQKKTSRDKSKEGSDYFATPEPLGIKMVEWADPQPNERMCEPSAGHGAIGRFFPTNTKNTYVEPSMQLAGDLKLSIDDGDPEKSVKMQSFEDLDTVNKFDCIVMNPPFGTQGKLAAEHLIKATQHLANGGRIVAILPDGPAMNKRIEKFFDSTDAIGVYPAAEISLPSVTFSRAGTNVKTKVLILDKQMDAADAPQMVRREFDAKDIGEFFDKIKDSMIPKRKKPSGEDTTRVQRREREISDVLEAAEHFWKEKGDHPEGLELADVSQIISELTGVGPGITRDALRTVYHIDIVDGKTRIFNEAVRSKEEVVQEAVQEEAEKDPNHKEIPPEIVEKFKGIGITVKINTSATRLGFGYQEKSVEAYSRILLNQKKGDGNQLYKGKDDLKKYYNAKFHKDWDGYTDFYGAWWHISAEHLDELDKVYDLL